MQESGWTDAPGFACMTYLDHQFKLLFSPYTRFTTSEICWYAGMLVCWYAGMDHERFVSMLVAQVFSRTKHRNNPFSPTFSLSKGDIFSVVQVQEAGGNIFFVQSKNAD
jgi:hypothetical protein